MNIDINKFHNSIIASQTLETPTEYLSSALLHLVREKCATNPNPIQDNSFVSTTPHSEYISNLLYIAYLRLLRILPTFKFHDPLQSMQYIRNLIHYSYLSYNSFYHRKNQRVTISHPIQAQEYNEAIHITDVYTSTEQNTNDIIHPLTQSYIDRHADTDALEEYNFNKLNTYEA